MDKARKSPALIGIYRLSDSGHLFLARKKGVPRVQHTRTEHVKSIHLQLLRKVLHVVA